jgi:hypothetical protein
VSGTCWNRSVSHVLNFYTRTDLGSTLSLLSDDAARCSGGRRLGGVEGTGADADAFAE